MNSNNSSFIISSIIKTIIFILIFGLFMYGLKTYKPDVYNKYIYCMIFNGEFKSNEHILNKNTNSATQYNRVENQDYAKTNVSESEDNRVMVSSTKTTDERKVVGITTKQESTSTQVNSVQQPSTQVNSVQQQPSTQSTPKFIDGYEVITIEDTEPYELSENSSSSTIKKQNFNSQKSPTQFDQVQQEVVYVEPEIPEDYDGPNWAVVAVNTEIYSKENIKVGSILGGIIVETNNRTSIKNTTLIQCYQIKDGDVKREVEFYVKESDLVMFRGPYTTELHPDKTTIIDFCTLRGKYQSLLDELRKTEIKKNPHYTDYQKAVTAYKALKQESDELEEKRKTTSGAAKANLEDRIHKLKLEEVTARKTLNNAQRKYDSWRNANLGAGDDIKITPTPELNKLKHQMDALYPRANEICPGI